MKRSFGRIGAVLAAVLLSCVAFAVPARAASGGGCNGGYPISACISFSGTAGGTVLGDFYMNASPTQTWCRAWMEVRTTNVGTRTSQTWYVALHGHYGPMSVVVNTIPPSRGSAVTIVHMLDCNGNPTYTSPPSPRVYFP